MPIKTLAIALAAVGAMLLFAVPRATWADEINAADDNLALPDQPAGNDTLAKQSGSTTPVTIVGATNTMVQPQPNTIIAPTAMTMAIAKSGSIAVGSSSSTASITSSVSTAIIQNGSP
jgi:hypothetical protein